MPINRYFKTDRVFHESFLEILEDSVNKNPDLTQKVKMSKNAEIIYQYVQNDFFILNQYEPKDISFHNRLIAIQELTDLGLIKKRNCDGIAWEKITL